MTEYYLRNEHGFLCDENGDELEPIKAVALAAHNVTLVSATGWDSTDAYESMVSKLSFKNWLDSWRLTEFYERQQNKTWKKLGENYE